MRIPILTDEAHVQGGWHGAQLAQAFAARGVEAVFVSLQECAMDVCEGKTHITIPHFSALPPCAFVRGVAGGTMQQITTRLNILHWLAMQGVKVYNSGRAIERTVDKAMTSFLLARANIATPATWVGESRHAASAWLGSALQQHGKVVMKPLFGSQGKGLRLITHAAQQPTPMDAQVEGVYYLQRFVESGAQNHDYRVMVIANKAVAMMRRSGNGWLNNVAQGAKCEAVQEPKIARLAEQAAQVLEIDYCGVDMMRDTQGKLWVIEVNSIPAWRGLQSVVDAPIAQLLVDDLLEKAPCNTRHNS